MSTPGLTDQKSNIRQIALFWAPLAAMWLFMGVEMPIINAFIARLPAAKDNLAAFGVVFSISVLVESPIVQMLTTGTALAVDRRNYRRLLNFMKVMGISLTALHLLVAFTPLFGLVLGTFMGIPQDIIEISRLPFILFSPFTAAVGFRRLWQGVLIKYGRTKAVTATMIVRFIFTLGLLVTGYLWTDLGGALLGALALTGGVLSGALAAWVLMRRVYKIMDEESSDTSLISWRDLIRFYIPLALTSIIIIGVRPVLSAGIARGEMPLESLAVWPVIHGFVFLFRSVTMSYQEVVVAMMDQADKRPALLKFTKYLALGIAGIYLVTACTALSDIWFRDVTGLEDDLLPFTFLPFLIGAPVPVLTAIVSYYRGVLVHGRKTKIIAWAVTVNSAVVLVVLFTGVALTSAAGAVIASTALSISIILETLFLKFALGKTEMMTC